MTEAGAPEGRAVFGHMGMPNSRLLYEPWVRLAEVQGIRLIGYDRPGYGGSERDAGRSVARCAEDVQTIAETLGVERMAMWGVSAGGPHALACAALLGDLVAAVAVLASPAPPGADGVDDDEGDDSDGVPTDPAVLRAELEEARAEMLAATPEATVTGWQEEESLSAADSDALTPALAGYLRQVGASWAWHRALTDGATIIWHSSRSPGGLRSSRSGCRCWCCMVVRIGSCRSRMASGWPPTFQRRRHGSLITTGISRSWAESRAFTSGCWSG